MRTKNTKKSIRDFVDSSEDEIIIQKDPYPRLPLATASEFNKQMPSRLKNIREVTEEIFNKQPLSHQWLLKNPAVAVSRKKSKFPAPLDAVSKIDVLPSKPAIQKHHEDTIVPAFRGIKWNNSKPRADLFCFTRADWLNTYHFASMTFKMAQIDIAKHTRAFLAIDEDFLEKYKHYELTAITSHGNFSDNNAELTIAANKLKDFFACADKIFRTFAKWKEILPEIRNITDKKIVKQIFTFSEILSYIYVNNYDNFKKFMGDFDSVLDTLDDQALTDAFHALEIPEGQTGEGMYHLSEGQIPRHALLYAFGVKNYTKGKLQEPSPLYTTAFKPENKNVYLGKIMVTCNPHTLFKEGESKAHFIPDFDAAHGSKIIAKTVVPEKEIQHRGANLQGKISHSVNVKLPKFHHQQVPERYHAKYGMDKACYMDFKETFHFLLEHHQFGKLAWMYLESVLLAHLIQFHEHQLYKYCNQVAYESNKHIFWVSRKEIKIDDPFPLEFDSSSEPDSSNP